MSVNISIIHRDSLNLRLLIEGVPLHILSSLRRAVLEEVPTMAVDTVFVIENNSVIHDENLAHRLAMIPLYSEEALKKYRSPEECANCPTCEDCYARLVLEVSNDSSEKMPVYSGDLKSEDPDIKPVYDNIPIVILGRGQRISLEAHARLGRGKEHIKWSPATVATLTYLPVLEFDLNSTQNSNVNECLKCIGNHFKELVDEIRKREKGVIELPQVKNTSLIRFCVEKVCGGPGSPVKISYLDSKLLLSIESSGSLKPETILFESVSALKSKISTLKEMLEKQ